MYADGTNNYQSNTNDKVVFPNRWTHVVQTL
jgi:hypothetical protein